MGLRNSVKMERRKCIIQCLVCWIIQVLSVAQISPACMSFSVSKSSHKKISYITIFLMCHHLFTLSIIIIFARKFCITLYCDIWFHRLFLLHVYFSYMCSICIYIVYVFCFLPWTSQIHSDFADFILLSICTVATVGNFYRLTYELQCNPWWPELFLF